MILSIESKTFPVDAHRCLSFEKETFTGKQLVSNYIMKNLISPTAASTDLILTLLTSHEASKNKESGVPNPELFAQFFFG